MKQAILVLNIILGAAADDGNYNGKYNDNNYGDDDDDDDDYDDYDYDHHHHDDDQKGGKKGGWVLSGSKSFYWTFHLWVT